MIEAADRVIVTAPQLLEEMRTTYADQSPEKFSLITNGFDPADYQTATPRHFDRLAVVYTGKLLRPYAPGPLLDGLEQLVTVETNYGDQFYHYIKAFLDLPAASFHYSRAGGIPMYLSEVLNFIMYNISLPDGFAREIVEERLSW